MKENTKKIINKLLSLLSLALLLFAAGLLMYVSINRAAGKTPQIFGYSFHFVVSNSMEPDIMTGDFVIGKKTTPQQLFLDNLEREESAKDTILFVSPNPSENGRVIVHKIRSITKTDDGYQIYTYGTNNPSDDILPTTEVIGKVVATSSLLGKILNPLGLILLLAILTAAIILYLAIKSLIKTLKPQQNP